jgi:hypothetical protein
MDLLNLAEVEHFLGNINEACIAWKKAKELGDNDASEFINKYCKGR